MERWKHEDGREIVAEERVEQLKGERRKEDEKRIKERQSFAPTRRKFEEPRSRLWSPYAVQYDPLTAGSIDATDTEPHDRGIRRAMSAHYRPNDKVTDDPGRTLFVARFGRDVTETHLQKIFERYGKVRTVRVVRDIVTGMSRQYGFVEFSSRSCCADAWKDANGLTVGGREILVEWEHERRMPGWVPRRMGGGFGGRKETGQLRFGGRDRPFMKPLTHVQPEVRWKRSSDVTPLGSRGENLQSRPARRY